MNTAFEVTADDVLVVMANNLKPVTIEQAENLFDLHISLNADEIEDAALHGNDIDEQTSYAHDKIKEILTEAGVLP